MASRIILLVSPLMLLFPAALMASGFRVAGLLALLVVSSGVGALVRWHARQNDRDGDLWGFGAFFFPLITPIVLALLPLDPYSASSQLRASSQTGRATPAKGRFEERFPLLTQCLEAQTEATRAGMRARFQAVKVNFEFLLPTSAVAVSRLLEEARCRGLAAWTGASGNAPLVYGAGLVRPSTVEEAESWLAAAGAPGQKLTIAFRDAEGVLHFIEHRFEQTAGAGG